MLLLQAISAPIMVALKDSFFCKKCCLPLEMRLLRCNLPSMMKPFCIFAFPMLAVISPAAEPVAPPIPILQQLNASFSSVFSKASPSVVVIEAKGQPASVVPDGLELFFRGPNGVPYRVQPENNGQTPEVSPNIGSGFIISADGQILTNNHVIADAVDISVKLKDGRRFSAEVIGADERSDLAVLKINAPDLSIAELGDSDAVKVGEFAFAIGTPMELPYTFTFGVVSAKGRNLGLGGHYDEYLQTDTSINPGNSGGPLCDIQGRVIGINTLISGNNRGVGFAIPINAAKDVAGQIVSKGYVSRPWLGVSIASLEDLKQWRGMFQGATRGVVVRGVEPGAPAQMSDLAPGDVITKVDGKAVELASDLQREILTKKIGQSVALDIVRQGKVLRIAVKTGEQPDKFMRASVRRPASKPPTPRSNRSAPPSTPGLTVKSATPENLAALQLQRKESGGVVVTEVEPYSASAAAGLEVGDVITEAGGRLVFGPDDIEAAISLADQDHGVLLLLERRGQKTFAILKP